MRICGRGLKPLWRAETKQCRFDLPGSLSENDDDGSENITKKINLLPFKVYRVYLEPLSSSIVGDFSWSWIFKVLIHVEMEKGKFVVVSVHVLHETSH